MNNINIHNVTKIEVKPKEEYSTFCSRDIVIHSLQKDYKTGEYIPVKLNINLFLEDKDVAKLVYSKD